MANTTDDMVNTTDPIGRALGEATISAVAWSPSKVAVLGCPHTHDGAARRRRRGTLPQVGATPRCAGAVQGGPCSRWSAKASKRSAILSKPATASTMRAVSAMRRYATARVRS